MTPCGSCDTALAEICNGGLRGAGDPVEVGELGPDASELVSESRRMETFELLFLDVSDLRLGEYRRVLKTLSHVEGLAPVSAGTPSHLGFAGDLLSMFLTWLNMGSRVCRVVCGPWSSICCVSRMSYEGALSERGEWSKSIMGTLQGASSPMVYEMPFTTPARGALFCSETVLVVDILAGGYPRCLSAVPSGVTSPRFEFPSSRRRASLQGWPGLSCDPTQEAD